jgi:hypothetical protein
MFYLFPGHSSMYIIGPDKHLLICIELKFGVWKSHLNWRTQIEAEELSRNSQLLMDIMRCQIKDWSWLIR